MRRSKRGWPSSKIFCAAERTQTPDRPGRAVASRHTTARLLPIVTAIVLAPALASAQDALTPHARIEHAPGFLPDYTFLVGAAAFLTDDERFEYDADIGIQLDIFDYGAGRLTFLGNYQAVLGNELRRFDVNQGNYTLDVATSVRLGGVELIGVFHHVSRHLSDRPKRFAIDWNMLGLQVLGRARKDRLELELAGRALWTVQRSFVDYENEFGGRVAAVYPAGSRVSAIGKAALTLRGVESSSSRGTRRGGILEGGLRISGRRAVFELFLAYERRIDADALEGRTRDWALVGWRVLNR